jgi:hypothetical protein
MNQTFHPSMNTISRVSIFGAIFFLIGLGAVINFLVRSSYNTGEDIALEQPIPFSHEHHVDQLGIDCRYCHTSVEEAAFAGIPSTETCMTCHSQVWTEAPILEPVRESFRTGQPLQWNRVHDVPDFTYFNHSIHVHRGIGCETCHGRVDQMPLVWKEESLFMEWCLECHRNPQEYIRPRSEVFTMGWRWPAEVDPVIEGHRLVEEAGIEVGRLDDCSICHR